MESILAAELDAHLCDGGIVVAASDRAARALLAAFHRARRAEGLEAWPAPLIFDWQTFVRRSWEERTVDIRLQLNAQQEQSLWEQVIAASGHTAALLPGPRRNLAAMAMQAHALLCSYAPRFLDAKARVSWQQDPAAFSCWLSALDALCRDLAVVSPSRLPLEATSQLASSNDLRPPLLLAGFDRLLPIQQQFFDAWGSWSHVASAEPAATINSFAAPDPGTELSACAAWCRQRLAAEPHSRILVISQAVRERRGEFERAFLREASFDHAFQFEFSLGVPLAQTPPARSAQLLLSWLDGELAEHQMDWLFSSPYSGATKEEAAALQAIMRALRHRGYQRTHWSLRTFLAQRTAAGPAPSSWAQRMTAAQNRFQSQLQRHPSPAEWAELSPHLLATIGWPGQSAATSAEFQVQRRWQQALENCASLGFDGRKTSWRDFLDELLRTVDEILFAPESEDAPILIAGPAESAGLTADAVWFMGVDEDAWPARGEANPLLPPELQRGAGMPHSAPQLDWDVARATTMRLLTSAPEVTFSHAHQAEGVEKRPSRLVAEFGGSPAPLPANLIPAAAAPALTLAIEDVSGIQYHSATGEGAGSAVHLPGGAGLLTAQSQCPFKAFATARLGASAWDPAETGLTAADRGQLLHQVLRSVWAGPPGGIRSLDDLHGVADLPTFVAAHVRDVMAAKVPSRVREQMPARYLELEAIRLTRLVTEWLEYEQTRVAFEVADTEAAATPAVGGISLDLRLDRLDRLNDGTMLVIDYKTGDVSPKSWDLPRPEDVQLPLYAGFGLAEDALLGGLVFAKVRAGAMCFAGRVGDAAATLDSSLKANSSLVKYPMTAEQLMDWREAIEQLARDFLAGHADVDPRDGGKTCSRCGLQIVCRILEREPAAAETEEEVAHD